MEIGGIPHSDRVCGVAATPLFSIIRPASSQEKKREEGSNFLWREEDAKMGFFFGGKRGPSSPSLSPFCNECPLLLFVLVPWERNGGSFNSP